MLRTVFILAVVACLTKYSSSYYTIVGPSYIQSDSKYSVAVYSDALRPTSISLTIQNDKDFSTSKSITVQAQSSQIVEFSIGSLGDANYKFIATGLKGLEFKNETTLTFQQKRKSVFIQTDKAMYKPSDKVKFRVIVVDRNLNPAQIKNMDIYITDASNNRVEQWLGASISKGVYVGELKLGSTPCLGNWKINVDVDKNAGSEKEFEVAEYVLPKFEVTVLAPKDSTYSDGSLQISAKASYTYGQPVKGTAQVDITRNNYWDPTPQPIIASKSVPIDGTGIAEFQLVSDLKISSDNWQDEFLVTVSVTEALTGVVLKGTTIATVRRTKFSVSSLNTNNNYVPGPYTVSLQFSYFDGSPYSDSVNTIKVSYGSDYNKTKSIPIGSGTMGVDGVANIPINLPDTGETYVYIFIQYLDYFENVVYLYKAQPSQPTDENSLSVTLATQKVKIGDTISLEVSSVNDLSSVTYLLAARGNLLLSKTQKVAKKKTVVITFKATFAMVPAAQFVVYYIKPSGDIVAGNVEVSVSGLDNFVTIKTSDAEKQPGESVGITISSKPSSYVCLLGIDQSVALLKTGNDIQQSDAYDELASYYNYGFGGEPISDDSEPIGPGPRPFPGPILLNPVEMEAQPAIADVAARKKRSSIWWPGGGGGGARPSFYQAGLFLLTSCNEAPRFYYRFDDMMAMEGVMVEDAMVGGAVGSPTSTSAVRKYFPETWIWDCFDSGSGSITRNEKAPDTITSWYLTGFATNKNCGLGVTEDKTVFKVFKKFFISLNLPYSVKRGEAVKLQIVIFNYLPDTVTTKVTLDNSLKQFEFVDPNTQAYIDLGCPQATELSRSQTITVNANDGVSLTFLITPKVIGPMTIKVAATSPVAGDAIEMPLLVEAEGVTQYKNKALFVDLRSTKTFTADLTVDIPKDVVPDSTKVEVTAIGDILGCALQNVDNLIQMPSGCGEQTMLSLSVDVAIYVYLTKTNLMTASLNVKLTGYMKEGVQNEMRYKHTDNSYSAFGNSDPSGSTWLTGFVLRIFIQARPYTTIDENVLASSFAWLAAQQEADGRFNEPGNICHTDMQGEATKGVALTAYIVVTFLEDPAIAANYASVIDKAFTYIYDTLKTLDDVYSLAIAAYAAQKANYVHKDELLQKLDSLAKVQGDLKWWAKAQLANPTDPWNSPPSVNVEITGYAVQAFIIAGRVLDTLPMVKWLIAQQSASGGFQSTQDTVVGITALAAFAAEISGSNVMSCTFNYASSSSSVNIDQTNSLVLQSVEIPSTTKLVQVSCTGSGFSLVQLSYQFNLNNVEVSPRFTLTVEVDKKSNDYALVLNICASFIAGPDGDTTNMAIIEAALPTGFTTDLQTTTDALSSVKGFKKVETKKGNTVVVIYLDNLSTTTICLQVTAYRLCEVADEKPVAVCVQDYYRTERRKTTFYSRSPRNVCSLCDTDECKAACGKPSKDIKCLRKSVNEILAYTKDIFKALKDMLRRLLAKNC